MQQRLHPHSYPDGQQQQHFKQHASHQQYAMHVSTDVEPTQEELQVFKLPTYAHFYALLDNYRADEDMEEQLTAADEQEQVAFIEEISRTAPIQYVPFEHVFVGEIKQQAEVSGFHNWIQFYMEEAKGTVKYLGYVIPRRHGESVSAYFPRNSSLMLLGFAIKNVWSEISL
ncbi:unnamed protein product [Sphagnum jensenii]|uniref:EndoU domain-containing protein n=1 Tax=Sphagnum jensenii TaxID=128206 RepID=A0ABP0W6J6_9BRYO